MSSMEHETHICPGCRQETFTVINYPYEVPYFGPVNFYIMQCSNCHYKRTDVLSTEQRPPARYRFQVESTQDLSVRVIKDSQATVIIPGIIEVESSSNSEGYLTNVEGVLDRLKHALDFARRDEEDATRRERLDGYIETLEEALAGRQSITLVIEDPKGNSAIISEKTVEEALENETGSDSGQF